MRGLVMNKIRIAATFKGKPVYVVDRHYYGRQGTDSPETTVYILEDGRRVLPAHSKYGLFRTDMNGLFSLIYAFDIAKLIPTTNSVIKCISKEEFKGSMYHIPVVLGVEHGVTFNE